LAVGWKVAIWAVIVLAALLLLYLVRSILLPFVLAFIISMLLEPTVKRLRRKGFSRVWSVLLVFGGFFAVAVAILVIMVPLIVNQFGTFTVSIQQFTTSLATKDHNSNFFVSWNPVVRVQPPGASAQIDEVLDQNRALLERLGIPADRKLIVSKYVEPHRAEIARAVENFFQSFLRVLGSAASSMLMLLFVPLFVLMILLDLENFRVRSASWIPPSIRAETLSLLREVGQVFINYLRGVTIAVSGYTIAMMIWLAILQAPNFAILAILFGIVYVIPYVGPLISCATLFTVTMTSGETSNWLMSFSSPIPYALCLTLLFLVGSTLFDQLVYPRLVGKSVGLHPLVSMFVVFSGAALFGLVGMIIAFPLAGSIKVVLDRLLKVTSSTHSGDLNLPATPIRHRAVVEV